MVFVKYIKIYYVLKCNILIVLKERDVKCREKYV